MISVIGIGPGTPNMLTDQARTLLQQSDIIVGWPRALELVADISCEKRVISESVEALVEWLQINKQRQIAVLASGDPMLYGIGKAICTSIEPSYCQVCCGISSIQILFARAGLDMNDLYVTSCHGKLPDFDFVLQHRKVALVTDSKFGPYQIAQEVLKRTSNRLLLVGENLSYHDERITLLPAEQIEERSYQMNVVVVLDER